MTRQEALVILTNLARKLARREAEALKIAMSSLAAEDKRCVLEAAGEYIRGKNREIITAADPVDAVHAATKWLEGKS